MFIKQLKRLNKLNVACRSLSGATEPYPIISLPLTQECKLHEKKVLQIIGVAPPNWPIDPYRM